MYMFILGVLFGSGLVLAFQTLRRMLEQRKIERRRAACKEAATLEREEAAR